MKLVRSSFELFKPRNKHEDLMFDGFENFYQNAIPPIYRCFMKHFDVKKGAMVGEEVMLDDREMKTTVVDLIYTEETDLDIAVYDFLSLEEGISASKNAYGQGDGSKAKRYAPIATCAFNAIVLLGITADNSDQVFFESMEAVEDESKIIKIASDVFEFISKLALKEADYIARGVDNHSQLYKNWGEDFWRVSKA